MKKYEFVELVRRNGGYNSKAEAEKAIKAFTESISEALSKHDNISILGFGSFSAVLQKGKTGKVPGTDKTYKTEDKMVPKFKTGSTLKDRVAAGK